MERTNLKHHREASDYNGLNQNLIEVKKVVVPKQASPSWKYWDLLFSIAFLWGTVPYAHT